MIPYGRHYIDEKDIDAVVDVLKNGWLTQGPKIDELESIVADLVGSKYAVAVSSATAGLHLACMAINLGDGDNALVPPNTFVSTPNAVLYCGAKPIFVDIDPKTLNLSPKDVYEKLAISNNVKAILPVHFAGLPCDMAAISAAVGTSNIKIIEDAAHGLGASYECGAKVGSCKYSDFTIFSLHPVKGVTSGEGGIITTNDKSAYKKLLQLRSHGICKGNFAHLGISAPDSDPLFSPNNAFDSNGRLNPWYYEMQQLGFNYRMTDFQAALAISQIDKLEKFIARRREISFMYDVAFKNETKIRPAQDQKEGKSAVHIYVTRIPFQDLKIDRSEFMRRLMNMGVGTQVHYIPVNWQPFYKNLGYAHDLCPEANAYYGEALTIPLFYGLSDEEIDHIIESIKIVLSEI